MIHNEKNILITSASRKVSLIKAFKQALADEGGGQVIAVDADPLSPALYFADKSFVIPSGLDEDFLSAIKMICRNHHINLIVPTRDEELPFFAERRELFSELGVTIMVPNINVVRTCQDKKLFIEFCLNRGFSVPKVYKTLKDITKFPVFVRERYGKGSKRAFRVDSAKELKSLISNMEDPIVQEYVGAQEYTIDLFADFSGRILSIVPRERIKVLAGESFIGRTCKIWPIINEAKRLSQNLGLIGHNTIQCFWDGTAVKFIEVNPRYGGGASLSLAAGAFTPLMLVRIASGKEVKECIGDFKEGFYMLRYTEDIFLSKEELIKFDESY